LQTRRPEPQLVEPPSHIVNEQLVAPAQKSSHCAPETQMTLQLDEPAQSTVHSVPEFSQRTAAEAVDLALTRHVAPL
jgi:hypothetical protein